MSKFLFKMFIFDSERSTGTMILLTALKDFFHVFLCISVSLGLSYRTVERQLEAFDRHVGRSKAKIYLSTGSKNPVV